MPSTVYWILNAVYWRPRYWADALNWNDQIGHMQFIGSVGHYFTPATNTTWKARKLFNNNRDAHENSHHFTMDLGYHVSDVPPSDGPLQIRTWSLGTFLQWKQQCHNDHQGQLVPMEHPVHRRGCANDQPRRNHQVPVEFHFPVKTPGYTNSPFLWPGKAPSAAGAMRQLQQVEFFMKIPTAESNNERRRKNLS